MPNRLLGLLLLVFFVASSAGPAAAQERYTLVFDPPEDASYVAMMEIQSKMDFVVEEPMEAAGQEFGVTQGQTYTYDYRIETVTADTVRMTSVIRRIQGTNESPQGSMEYDTDDPSAQNVPGLQALLPMIGKEVTVALSPKGEVYGISGFDAIVDGMASEEGEMTAAERDTMRAQLERQFGDGAFSMMTKTLFQVYPQEPVAIGDSWDVNYEMNGPFPMVIDATFTLRGVEDGMAMLGFQSTLEAQEGATAQGMGGAMDLEMKGDQEGTYQMDLDTGLIRRMDIEQDMDMTMSGQASPGQTMVMGANVTGTSTIDVTEEE